MISYDREKIALSYEVLLPICSPLLDEKVRQVFEFGAVIHSIDGGDIRLRPKRMDRAIERRSEMKTVMNGDEKGCGGRVLMDFQFACSKGDQTMSPVMGSNFRAVVWGASHLASTSGALSLPERAALSSGVGGGSAGPGKQSSDLQLMSESGRKVV